MHRELLIELGKFALLLQGEWAQIGFSNHSSYYFSTISIYLFLCLDIHDIQLAIIIHQMRMYITFWSSCQVLIFLSDLPLLTQLQSLFLLTTAFQLPASSTISAFASLPDRFLYTLINLGWGQIRHQINKPRYYLLISLSRDTSYRTNV